MKIAYVYDVVYPYVKGGAEKRFWELARRLAAKDHQVHLYGMKSWEGEPSFISEGVHIHGIGRPRRLYLKSGARNSSQVIHLAFGLFPELNKERFDIIDCNAFPYLTFFPVKRYTSLHNTPLVMTWQEVWDKYWFSYLGYIKGSVGRAIEKRVISLSDHIIAHSKKTTEALLRSGFRGKEIRLISHGVELDAIKSIPPSQQKSDMLFAGRLIKDKNAELIIRALSLIKKELPQVRCAIIGEGPEKERLLSLSKELGLADNIRFTGFLEYNEVIAMMKASKVFVFPSQREGFGIVAIEALSCGLPVITVDHPMNAATEIVKDGKNGYICRIDASCVAAKIKDLLENDALRLKMSEEAKTASAGNDWDKITDITFEFYKEIIAGKC